MPDKPELIFEPTETKKPKRKTKAQKHAEELKKYLEAMKQKESYDPQK